MQWISADITASKEQEARTLASLINENWCPDWASQDGLRVVLKGPMPEETLHVLAEVAEDLVIDNAP